MRVQSWQVKKLIRLMHVLSETNESQELRLNAGYRLLDLFRADYFASYIWDDSKQRFDARVNINMSPKNLSCYEEYFQFHDPITLALMLRQRATLVSEIMPYRQLQRTEFFNDFLQKDGLSFGMNFHATHFGKHVGDVRIWRARHREDFSFQDTTLLDMIGPSLINAFRRGLNIQDPAAGASLQHTFGLTRREDQIAQCAIQGLSDSLIADQLHISKATVRSHLRAIFRKCGIRRRSQLARINHDTSLGHKLGQTRTTLGRH